MTPDAEPITKEAIAKAGGVRKLSELLNISYHSIWKWKRVPAARVVQVSEITGIPRTKLRPDIFLPRAVRS